MPPGRVSISVCPQSLTCKQYDVDITSIWTTHFVHNSERSEWKQRQQFPRLNFVLTGPLSPNLWLISGYSPVHSPVKPLVSWFESSLSQLWKNNLITLSRIQASFIYACPAMSTTHRLWEDCDHTTIFICSRRFWRTCLGASIVRSED